MSEFGKSEKFKGLPTYPVNPVIKIKIYIRIQSVIIIIVFLDDTSPDHLDVQPISSGSKHKKE